MRRSKTNISTTRAPPSWIEFDVVTSQRVGTSSWSRYVQMCASYLTIQHTTLVGTFEIRFRTLVYEQLETRETFTLSLTPRPTLTPNPTSRSNRSNPIQINPIQFKSIQSNLFQIGPIQFRSIQSNSNQSNPIQINPI